MEATNVAILHERQRFAQDELNSILLGPSDDLAQVRNRIFEASRSDANVLILGETGTGKEIVAREIHRLWAETRGKTKGMVTVNCASIPDGLCEAELFGAKKGAATNVGARPGKFKEADGTTLFLDEIGDIPPESQGKLLRAVQFKTFTPVGGKEERSDFRLICATNQAISPEAEGRKVDFRKEFFYRVSEITIQTTPLRSRREDIVPIFIHLLRQHIPSLAKERYRVRNVELYYLLLNDWPGNVREIERLIVGGKPRVEIYGRLGSIFEPALQDVLSFVCSDTEKRGWPDPKLWKGLELDIVKLADDVAFESDRCWVSPDFDVPGANVKDTEAFEESLRDLLELDRVVPEAATSVRSDKVSREEKKRGSHSILSETPEPSIVSKTTLEDLAAKPVSLDDIQSLYLREVLRQHRPGKGKHGKSLNWLAGELGRKYDTLKKMIEDLDKGEPNQN